MQVFATYAILWLYSCANSLPFCLLQSQHLQTDPEVAHCCQELAAVFAYITVV